MDLVPIGLYSSSLSPLTSQPPQLVLGGLWCRIQEDFPFYISVQSGHVRSLEDPAPLTPGASGQTDALLSAPLAELGLGSSTQPVMVTHPSTIEAKLPAGHSFLGSSPSVAAL